MLIQNQAEGKVGWQSGPLTDVLSIKQLVISLIGNIVPCALLHIERVSYPGRKTCLRNLLCQLSPASGAGELLTGAIIPAFSCAEIEKSAGFLLGEEAAHLTLIQI